MKRFISSGEFRDAARRGRTRGASVVHPGARVLRTPDDGSRIVPWVLSDGSVDRMTDTINPNGWDVAAYKQNPVVLFAHDANSPPIGRMRNIYSDGQRLIGEIEFAGASVYPFAEQIFQLVLHGFLKAGSVGFRPLEYSWSEDPDRPFGIDFIRQELLEFSICAVPALPSALLIDGKSGNLSSEELQMRSAAGAARLSRTAAGELLDPIDPGLRARIAALKARLAAPARRFDLAENLPDGERSLSEIRSQLAEIRGRISPAAYLAAETFRLRKLY